MKAATAQALLLVSVTVAVQAALAGIPKAFNPLGNALPNQFIIEVERVPQSLGALYASLHERGIDFGVMREYDATDILVGAAVTLTNPRDAALLANAPGVKAIRPIVQYDTPKPAAVTVVSGPNDPAVPGDTQSTHIMTGVDNLHKKGITGSGVKIGIIDTGVDYTHPVLGGGIGSGFKIVGGYDFVGSAYNGTNKPIPGPDPLDKCNGHGTHVAGIIGADPNNPFNISGVAYKASLYAYRIFGCQGTVSDDIIIEALLRGAKDGNDILTLSLGGRSGWTESMASVVASRIAASGTIVTIAAGNDGGSGSWYSSAPATGIDVISVGSVDSAVYPLQSVLVSGVKHDPIVYFSFKPLPTTGSFPIYVTSNDTRITADACNPLPSTTPDLSKYVTIIRRGTCSFVQKLENVAAKGGKLVLIYDNGNGIGEISTGNFTNAALIQAADGEFLVNQFASGTEVTLTFPKGGRLTEFSDPNGGLMSGFSSYGPTYDFFFKPALAAPGGHILSTIPTSLGSYAVYSGTSMSTPFVAGSGALLLAAKGKTREVARQARTLFQTTARMVPSSKTDGQPLQTVTQQGAGLINVYDAIYSTTRVVPGELILNDTSYFRPSQKFTVKNNGDASQSYKVNHIPAGTALTVRPSTIFPSLGPVPLSNMSASVLLTPDHFSLGPGDSQTVTAIFRLPTAGFDRSTYPVFSGFIEVQGHSVSDSYHVSYLGLAGNLKDKQVIDDTDQFFGIKLPALLNAAGDVQASPSNYTFVGGDAPTILGRLVFGTPSVTVDLVEKDIKFNSTISRRHWDNTFVNPHNGGSFAQVKTIGTMAAFEYLPRNSDVASNEAFENIQLSSTFANGTTIPNGDYRVLLRALRVTGNPVDERDYESWLSPIFGVQVPR